MIHGLRLPVAIVTAGLVLSNCLPAPKPPTEVVKAFYAAANDGRYADGEKYLSAMTLKEMNESFRSHDAGLKEMLDDETKNRSLDHVDYLNEQITGYRASVQVRVRYLSGQSRDERHLLLKEGGEWKVTLVSE